MYTHVNPSLIIYSGVSGGRYYTDVLALYICAIKLFGRKGAVVILPL